PQSSAAMVSGHIAFPNQNPYVPRRAIYTSHAYADFAAGRSNSDMEKRLKRYELQKISGNVQVNWDDVELGSIWVCRGVSVAFVVGILEIHSMTKIAVFG